MSFPDYDNNEISVENLEYQQFNQDSEQQINWSTPTIATDPFSNYQIVNISKTRMKKKKIVSTLEEPKKTKEKRK
jgi:hypothetical protein